MTVNLLSKQHIYQSSQKNRDVNNPLFVNCFDEKVAEYDKAII